uniref:Tick transposon n=1 Tax=Ixodes ricinus TaxID=34613 RepID=A0A6B0VA22_IXORI
MRLTCLNPLLFLLQVLACGFAPVSDRGSWYVPARVNYTDYEERFLVPGSVYNAAGFVSDQWFAATMTAPRALPAALSSSTSTEIRTHAPRRLFVSGQGSTAMRLTCLNPLLFLLQVGEPYCIPTFKSNRLCLVVLPCPKVLCASFTGCFDTFCLLVLLLSGDVELNPGPTMQEQLAAILENQKGISADISSMQAKLETHMADSNRRLEVIESRLNALTATSEKVEQCDKNVRQLQDIVAALTEKVDDLENRGRRNNIIIHGIEESQDENTESLKGLVLTEIFENKLGLKVTSVERIHRIGRADGRRPRPVILRLYDFNEKLNLLRNSRRLKGTRIFLSEDFSRRVQLVRKQLWDSIKGTRTSDDKVFLRYDKLFINGEAFTWDETTQRRNKLQNSAPALQGSA